MSRRADKNWKNTTWNQEYEEQLNQMKQHAVRAMQSVIAVSQCTCSRIQSLFLQHCNKFLWTLYTLITSEKKKKSFSRQYLDYMTMSVSQAAGSTQNETHCLFCIWGISCFKGSQLLKADVKRMYLTCKQKALKLTLFTWQYVFCFGV